MDVASMVAEESGLIMEYLYQVLATSLQNPRPRSHHLGLSPVNRSGLF